ncbi:hypoxanthine phosphoribosyltransferase [Fastidiosipila sanguinis]|uniref:Hypoxanthine phosphoribosyltransferase n=1 Tax=Fastidiosipila sanguinis TaxID=236753 RepID=A0A2S0KMM8_9FIRM|nr:hypoxanthine phosphoribosyltransferase [Fastidiosipila sanguinis]AVM42291.1 hypoxanthine phosphoribosyltransferase [Fastidiosipila sanguinis]
MSLELSDVMISKEEIQEMCKRVAAEINKDYEGKEVLFVGILNGAFLFLADLIRYIDVPCQVDFMKVSSYGNAMTSSGNVSIQHDLSTDIEGKHVIIVEDIIDTGITLNHLKPLLQTRRPASLSLCAAFDKFERRLVDLDIEYLGIQIPDEFIVGYGLDFDGHYRNLPDVHYMVNND